MRRIELKTLFLNGPELREAYNLKVVGNKFTEIAKIYIKNEIFFVLLITGVSMSSGGIYGNTPINNLKVNYQQMDSILLQLCREYNIDKKNDAIIVEVKKKTNGNEIRITFDSKNNFLWIMRDKKEEILGYYFFNEIPVLVFGDVSDIFNETKTYQEFKWLKPLLNPKSPKPEEIPLPPVIYEPEVWFYKVQDGKFKFQYRGIIQLWFMKFYKKVPVRIYL